MKKRAFAGLLWFYVTWDAWCFFAAFVGLSAIPGPILGAAVAMFIVVDPLGRIWVARPVKRPVLPTRGRNTESA